MVSSMHSNIKTHSSILTLVWVNLEKLTSGCIGFNSYECRCIICTHIPLSIEHGGHRAERLYLVSCRHRHFGLG
jgi:hypothetical protein